MDVDPIAVALGVVLLRARDLQPANPPRLPRWLLAGVVVGTAPYSLWIALVIPLVMGWLAWRARGISASMAAHGAVDAVGDLVAGSIYEALAPKVPFAPAPRTIIF